MSGTQSAHPGGAPRAGTRVAGRYRLEHEIGRGGMGVVWYAIDEVLDRPVAVKQVTIPPAIAHREAEVLRERVIREARSAGRVRHESAVTVYDVIDEDGTPYLVMELLDARSLAQIVRDDGPLSPRETARVGLALLGALEAAHAAGVIHRDVKPGNVLVADDGRVMLTDFGIASSQGDPTITATGLLLGSPAYIPPERARGTAGGPSSDIWSLAATLWTAVEGRPAYEGGNPVAILTAVVEGRRHEPVRAGELGPVLTNVLDSDADARPSARALQAQLERIAETDADDAEVVIDVTPVTAHPEQREQTQVLSAVTTASPRAATTVKPSAPKPARKRASPQVHRRRIAFLAVIVAAAAAGVIGWRAGGGGGGSLPLTKYASGAGWSLSYPAGWQPYSAGDKSWSKPASNVVYVEVDQNAKDDAKNSFTQTINRQRAVYPGLQVLSGPTGSSTDATAEWTQPQNGITLRIRDVHLVRGNHRYSLVFAAPVDQWSSYTSTWSAVARTFSGS